MILKLNCIYSAPRATPDKLRTVTREMTPEICEEYDRLGWKFFQEEDLVETFLPEICRDIFTEESEPVVAICGRNYVVKYSFRDGETGPEGVELSLIPTEREPTPDSGKKHSWHKIGGQPKWVQGQHFPADSRGNPCFNLLTVNNGWGDCGNFNILVGIDGSGVLDVAYFEASCC